MVVSVPQKRTDHPVSDSLALQQWFGVYPGLLRLVGGLILRYYKSPYMVVPGTRRTVPNSVALKGSSDMVLVESGLKLRRKPESPLSW